ncbi:MAG: type II secretion system protein N [Oceanococcaceae bacterium]
MRILLGAGALLVGLLAGVVLLAPASAVIGLADLPTRAPGLRVLGVDGRIWQGSAAYVQSGRTVVREVHWTLQPLSLLGMRVAGQVRARLHDTIPLRANVVLHASRAVDLRQGQTNLTISQLKPLLNLPFLPLDGQAKVFIDHLRLNAEQRPEALTGTITITNALWTLIKPDAALGDFRIEFRTDEDGQIIGNVSDQDARIGVSGTLTLTPDGQYVADLAIQPRAETPPMIRNTLPSLGRPNPDGSYPVRQRGRIPGW